MHFIILKLKGLIKWKLLNIIRNFPSSTLNKEFSLNYIIALFNLNDHRLQSLELNFLFLLFVYSITIKKPQRLLPTNLYVVLYNFKSRHQDELDLKAGYKVSKTSADKFLS